MESKLKKLIHYGKKANIQDLQKCVDDWDADEAVTLISRFILKDEFPQILGFFLDGLTQSGQSHIMRFKVTEKLIQEFEKCDIPLSKANTITNRLKLEVANFTVNHLVNLCDLCVRIISHKDDRDDSGTFSHMCWKELLPSMLSILLERRKLTQHGNQLTGDEYKAQLIRTLCQSDWSPKIATSLASMFINIPLTVEEHLQVVNKACSCMVRLSPQELPPMVHEMLDLCKDRHGLQLLMKLNHYFHSHLHLNKRSNSDDSSVTQMKESDSIVGDTSQEAMQAQSTVLYHINKVAGSHSSIRDFTNTMAKVARGAPEAVLQPVLVSMLFCIATLPTYEDQIFGILKNAIIRCVVEGEMRKESAWMRDVKISSFDIQELIVILIENSKNGQLGAEEGLVSLAFELLRAAVARGKEAATERVWYYGTFILLRLVRHQRHVANSVLQQLCDCIITGESVQQYTRCLGQMCREMRLVVMEQQTVVIGLLSYLRVIPSRVARDIVLAVLPIVLHAPSVRDNLILVLRKALFSKEVSTRKMAVHGFIEMLKNLRFEQGALGQLSQGSSSSTFSGYNILSQVSIEVHSQAQNSNTNTNTKEAICLEVLGALRGCLNQQSDVRACVYRGLVEVVESNPPLTGTVLFWLRAHFLKQCELDVLPPLRFNENIIVQSNEASLQEPLGLLVHLVQQVVQATQGREEEVDERNLSLLKETLDKLVDSMSRCQLENFDLDDDVRLMDPSVDNQKASEILKQALGVYEALICYCINTWTKDTAEEGAKILALHKSYSRLVDFAKNSTTGGAGTKKDVDASARTQPEKKGRFGRPPVFKLPPTILGLPFLSRALDLLHLDDVPWSTTHASVTVKGRREFQRFVMTVVVQYVGQLKADLQSGNMSILKPCARLASKLYSLCIFRLSEVDAFDRTLATLVLESFIDLVQMVLTYCRSKWRAFLQEMTNIHADDGVAEQLAPVVAKLHILLSENVEEDQGTKEEAVDKKMSQLLASALSLVAVQLPGNSQYTSEILEKVRTLCNGQGHGNIPLVRTMLQLLLTLSVHNKAESQLLVNMAKQLQEEIGVLPDMEAEDVSAASRLAFINSSTKQYVLTMVCTTLMSRLEEVDWMTARLEAEYTMLNFSSDDNSLDLNKELLRTKERETVCHIARCVQCAVSLSICAPPPGVNADGLLRLNVNIFDTLTHLTKYFIRRSSKENRAFEHARFDKVIKLSGKVLAKNMFAFIIHIGETKAETNQKKRRKGDPVSQKSKVLRETRIIPMLVRQKETFDHCVIKLAKVCKAQQLVDIVKHNSARDFNIKPQAVRRALEHIEDENCTQEAPSQNGADSGNESEDNNLSSHEEQGEDEEENDNDNRSESDEDRPPPKKSRRSSVV